MLIAIDESGSFGAKAAGRNFFVAIHLRQSEQLLKQKRTQFVAWERTLPRSLKDSKGEFKGSALSDAHLLDFAGKFSGGPLPSELHQSRSGHPLTRLKSSPSTAMWPWWVSRKV